MLIHHDPFVGWIGDVSLLEVNLVIIGAIPKFIVALSMLEFMEKVRIRLDQPLFFCDVLTYLSAGQ